MSKEEVVKLLIELDSYGISYYLTEDGWELLYKVLEEQQEEKVS